MAMNPGFNSYAPACTVNACLQQVAGIVDNNPLAQFSACASMFGSPVVTTITPTGDVAFTTDTASVSYTDIIVSPTTDVSTAVQTVTVPSQVSQTQTETVYSPTVVETTTITVLTDGPATTSSLQRRDKRRGRCGSKNSHTTSLSSSPTSALFPIASNCPSLEDYSSACACITAAAITQSVTLPAATSTSTAVTILSVAVSSTSLSSVLSVLTSTAYVTTPTTVTQTVTTPTTTTSTATSTVTLVPGGPCVANPVCAPAGLNIDYYENVDGAYGGVWGVGSISSSYYITQGLKPLDSSLTNVTSLPNDVFPSNLPEVYPYSNNPSFPYKVGWTRTVNGGITVDSNNFTLVFQGFFRPPVTGTYTFCTAADDESELFLGHGNAVSCLDGTAPPDATPFITTRNANADLAQVCSDVDLTAGLYYPVRNVMGNAMGDSALIFTFQVPSALGSSDDFTGYAYPLNCGFFA